jgi:hypothetical protein
MNTLYDRFAHRFDYKIIKVRDFYEYYTRLAADEVYGFLNAEENEFKKDFKFRMTMNVIITAIISFVLGWIAAVYIFE